MENPTAFDLNEAIRRWQEKLKSSPAVSAENLEELESHLRAAVQRWQAAGLSGEEAFLVAARRLGDQAPLEQEFAKVNSRTIWFTRGIWMLIGILAIRILESMEQSATYLSTYFVRKSIVGSVVLPIIFLSAQGLLVFLFYKMAVRRRQAMKRLLGRGLDWPLFSILGLIIVMFLGGILKVSVIRTTTPTLWATASLYMTILHLANTILIPTALVLMARRLRKNNA